VKRLEIVRSPGSAFRVPADTALVLVPRDERPLRGDAGRIDWRLCGAVSSLLESGYASGAAGESTLVPAGGAIAPRRLLLFGLGLSKHLGRRRIEQSLRRAGLAALELAAESLSLALPEALDLEFDAEPILAGLLLALEESDGEVTLRVFVPEASGQGGALERALAKLQPEAARGAIELRVRRPDPWPEALDAGLDVPFEGGDTRAHPGTLGPGGAPT
jgi:hypothetical protein